MLTARAGYANRSVHIMNENQKDTWGPNKRVSWALFTVVLAASCLAAGILAPSGLAPRLGRNWFLVGLGFGVFLALIVNLLRPTYETAEDSLKRIYDFLIRHFPIID